MSVTSTVNLPAVGGTGSHTDYIPLAGDGYSSPHSLYEVGVSLAGDAGGGSSTITLGFDPQYMSVLFLVDSHHNLSAAAHEFTFVLRTGDTVGDPTSVVRFSTVSILDPNVTLDMAGWSPPPLVRGLRTEVVTDNVDGDNHVLNAWVYNFRKDAHLRVPLGVLLSSLPRTGRGWPA